MPIKHRHVQRWVDYYVRLHWYIALFIAVALLGAFLGEHVRPPLRHALHIIHHSFGLSVLVLLGLQFWVGRKIDRNVKQAADWGDWTDWIAQGTHAVLYALLVMLPLLGWALVNARGHEVYLFTFLKLPNITGGINVDLQETLVALHTSAAWILLMMGVLHTGLAIWHHANSEGLSGLPMLPAKLFRRKPLSPDSDQSLAEQEIKAD